MHMLLTITSGNVCIKWSSSQVIAWDAFSGTAECYGAKPRVSAPSFSSSSLILYYYLPCGVYTLEFIEACDAEGLRAKLSTCFPDGLDSIIILPGNVSAVVQYFSVMCMGTNVKTYHTRGLIITKFKFLFAFCHVAVWTEKMYSSCSVTCGVGTMTWQRTCVSEDDVTIEREGCAGQASGTERCEVEKSCPGILLLWVTGLAC